MTSLGASSRLQNQLNTAQTCVKWVRSEKSRMIRSLFNVESPNFKLISMPIYYTVAPDKTSPASSDRHLSQFEQENPTNCGLRRNATCSQHEMFTNRKPIHHLVYYSQYKVLLHLPPFSIYLMTT